MNQLPFLGLIGESRKMSGELGLGVWIPASARMTRKGGNDKIEGNFISVNFLVKQSLKLNDGSIIIFKQAIDSF